MKKKLISKWMELEDHIANATDIFDSPLPISGKVLSLWIRTQRAVIREHQKLLLETVIFITKEE